ncbi:GerAB/ArcD/ProY family transporter [Paenibacillus oryzisoli]|uniref:GerAB/ArcD/ProY family transporter n=1 Tax=Paenibacillus oryzisoli TaxID=1850517 RepID=UPI003D2E4E51
MTRTQSFAFILQTQIGIAVLSVPYDLHKSAGADGWMSVLIAGAIVQLILCAYVLLCKRFPQHNLFDFAPIILGQWLGKVVNVAYIAHFLLTTSLIVLMEMTFVEKWILPFTNPWLVLVANCIVCTYLAKEPIRIIARYNVLMTFLIVVMLSIMMTSFRSVDFRYLLPIGQSGWSGVMAGAKSSFLSFLGFEVMLVLSGDVRSAGKSFMPPLLWANGLATLFFLLIVLVSYLNFSQEALDFIPQPVPYYLNGISLPFLERLDLLFLSIWLVKVTATLISYFYCAGKGLSQLFHLRHHAKAIYVLVPLVCALGFLWRSEERMEILGKIVEYESYIILGIPILLLLLAWLLGKRGQVLA